jgi:hypothetical protein
MKMTVFWDTALTAPKMEAASTSETSVYFKDYTAQHSRRPNVVVECLTFVFLIRDVPGSNIGPETGYPDRVFVVFLSPSR